LDPQMTAEGTVGAPTCYNINDSVLARVWYVVLLDLVTKAARLLNINCLAEYGPAAVYCGLAYIIGTGFSNCNALSVHVA
jgi:hypothetical protein